MVVKKFESSGTDRSICWFMIRRKDVDELDTLCEHANQWLSNDKIVAVNNSDNVFSLDVEVRIIFQSKELAEEFIEELRKCTEVEEIE